MTPLYILLLMALVLAATYFSKRLSRLLGRHSILQGLWLLFLISYFNIAMATFEILYCRWVGPVELGGVATSGASGRRYVLIHDASVQCYSGLHLPFAILAWVVAVLFALPLPVYVLILMRVDKLKPLSDVYCSHYRDKYRWWIFMSLARRLLLVLVGVFIQDYVSRHFGLLLAVAFVTLASMLATPYRSWLDNHFCLFVTWMLLLTAIVTQPTIYTGTDPERGVSLFLVVLTLVLGLGLAALEVLVRRLTKKKTVEEFFKATVHPKLRSSKKKLRDLGASLSWRGVSRADQHELEESTRSTASTIIPRRAIMDATGYREPLLDSQFYSSEEMGRFGGGVGGKGGIPTSSSLYMAPSQEDEATPFSWKKFTDREKEGEVGGGGVVKGVATTEVSTGHMADSGVATTNTTYDHYPTSS